MLGTRYGYIYLRALAQLSSGKIICIIENLVEFYCVYKWVGECLKNVLCTLSEIHLGLKMHMVISFMKYWYASSKLFLYP